MLSSSRNTATNIRSTLIPAADIPVIAADFNNFTPERIDIFCGFVWPVLDPSQKTDTRTNIANLAP